MTRTDALNKIKAGIEADRKTRSMGSWDWSFDDGVRACDQLAALEALGLITFEEPAPTMHHVPAVSYCRTGNYTSALVREETMINTLRAAGYEIKLKQYRASA